MTLSKIWVLAEATDGKVSSTTLELLTKARSLADTVECVYGGGDADAIAADLGAHGATTVHATGDLGGALAGVPVAAAIAAAVAAGTGPDAVIAATSYDGRDVIGRLSAKLDRTALTNNVDLEVDGGSLVCTTPVFGGTVDVKTKFTGEGPFLVLVRPKSFARAERWRRCRSRRPGGPRGARRRPHRQPPRRGGAGPSLDDADIVVSGTVASVKPRSSAWSRAGEAAQRRARCVACHRRRRLGALHTRSARPARSSSRRCTSRRASPAPRSTWWA
ncbi:MAG: hypothetical protein R2699_18100 [Acidimicrobiales bacterium]